MFLLHLVGSKLDTDMPMPVFAVVVSNSCGNQSSGSWCDVDFENQGMSLIRD
jgi:hypothetical protein